MTDDMTLPAELDGIAKSLGNLQAAEMRLRHSVRKARLKGQSWASIGMALGVSKQAAHERFRTVTGADCTCPLDPDDDALLVYQADCPHHG